MNYPLGIAILGFVGAGHLDHGGHRTAMTRTGEWSSRWTARRSPGGSKR